MWGLGQHISQNMAIKHKPVVEYNKLEFTANNCVIFQNDVRIFSLKPLQRSEERRVGKECVP